MNGWTVERALVVIILIFGVLLCVWAFFEIVEDNDGDGLRSAAVEQGWYA
jgi:hypothetical protein